MEEGSIAGTEGESLRAVSLAKLEECQPYERLESPWYDFVADQLQALIPRFGIEQSSARLYRAYELICRESLGLCQSARATRTSRLNHDGTPIQFALALGRHTAPLQFLSEAGNPSLCLTEMREFIKGRLGTLAALLQLKGDLDSIAALIDRVSAVNAHEADPDPGGMFWIGVSFAPGERFGLKLYINCKNGAENDQWERLHDFVTYFGALADQQELRQLVAGKMTPLGMAIALQENENPTGRIYLNGYGNLVSYYEDLLRHFGDEESVEAFRQFTEVMLEEDRAYPTQSVVFSAGFGSSASEPKDAKVEFCGHCLFRSDRQAQDRCLRWLALRKIDTRPYEELLDVITGQMSLTAVNTHIYLGLGWKRQQEYTTIYLKPHPNPA
jgi:hypothetical protein